MQAAARPSLRAGRLQWSSLGNAAPCRRCSLRPPARRQRAAPSAALLDRSGGSAGVLDRPGLENWSSPGPATESGFGAGDVDRRKGSGGGSWRVLLLDSDKHTEDRVVKAILTVVPGVEEGQARNCFHTARQIGMAIVCTALKEHAEHYAQMLYRYGCRASIEPDAATI